MKEADRGEQGREIGEHWGSAEKGIDDKEDAMKLANKRREKERSQCDELGKYED